MNEQQPPRKWALTLAAAGAGLGGGLLGTSLHGHVLHSGSLVIPLGAFAALLLLACLELFVGLWSRNAWVVVLTGGVAYLCGGLLSLSLGGFGMISNNLQGNIWLYGIAVMTPLVAWGTAIILRRSSRKS